MQNSVCISNIIAKYPSSAKDNEKDKLNFKKK